MVLRMSWRNIWRNRRRTLITGASVALGIILSISFTAAGDYSYTNIINTGALLGPGHVTVEKAGYNERPSLKKRVEDADAVKALALTTPYVRAAAERISGRAVFSSASRTTGGTFIAIDPAGESSETLYFFKALTKGRFFKGRDSGGAVIGKKMAERLHIGPGKKFVYTVTDVNGEIVSAVARVTGIYSTGVEDLDATVVILPIEKVRRTIGYGPGEATRVAVFLTDHRKAEMVRDIIEKKLKDRGLEVLTWRSTQVEMAGVVAIDRAMNYLFQFLVGILIASGILNTLLMAVMERKGEFGVMLALGLEPVKLVGLVLLESLWMGLVGLAAGVIVTIPWYAFMSSHGIELPGFKGADVGLVPLEPVLKFRLFATSAAAILAGIFTLTLLAGIWPAVRASRTDPVEGLREAGRL